MLIGNYGASFAPKRRVAVPKKFLVELGTKMVLTKWYETCLVLVSREKWQALLNRLLGEAKIVSIPVRDTERFIYGSAYEVMADNQGRIIIPEVLAKYGGFEKQVNFVGLGDRVEIWSEENWREKEKEVTAKAAGLLEEIVTHE